MIDYQGANLPDGALTRLIDLSREYGELCPLVFRRLENLAFYEREVRDKSEVSNAVPILFGAELDAEMKQQTSRAARRMSELALERLERLPRHDVDAHRDWFALYRLFEALAEAVARDDATSVRVRIGHSGDAAPVGVTDAGPPGFLSSAPSGSGLEL